MSIEYEDQSPEALLKDFATARAVVGKRLIEGPLNMAKPGFDVELFMQFTTILRALKIAEAVASVSLEKLEKK